MDVESPRLMAHDAVLESCEAMDVGSPRLTAHDAVIEPCEAISKAGVFELGSWYGDGAVIGWLVVSVLENPQSRLGDLNVLRVAEGGEKFCLAKYVRGLEVTRLLAFSWAACVAPHHPPLLFSFFCQG
jgi:hypothetical protein